MSITNKVQKMEFQLLQSSEIIQYDYNIKNNINRALKKLRKYNNESMKYVIVNNSQQYTFDIDLYPNEYLHMNKYNASIVKHYYGDLNLFVSPTKKQTLIFKDSDYNSHISFKGSGKINITDDRSIKEGYFPTKSEFNDSVTIELDSFKQKYLIDSIALSNQGKFKINNGEIIIQNLYLAPHTIFEFDSIYVNNTINIEQTATLSPTDNNRIFFSTLYYKIYDFEVAYPFIVGTLKYAPKKIILQKQNNDKSPYLNRKYVLVSGRFHSTFCNSWLNVIDFGNSGFDTKYCHRSTITNLSTNQMRQYDDYITYYYDSIILEKTKNKKKLSGGAIAGIVVGVIAAVAIIVVVVILVIRYKKNGKIAVSNESP